MVKNLAPIILFVYNRPWHTQETVEALQKNKLASESELFIYSDAAKNEQASDGVEAVRKYIVTINGFKKVTLIKRDKNWGLADSIIEGVTKIVNEYGKIIVLEDDLVTSPYFLNFMNEALNFYQDEEKVWHISGWNYPINTVGLDDIFFWTVSTSWTWATWSNRWQHFDKNTDLLISQFTKQDISEFNLGGARNFWGQVEGNKYGTLNTWAVFWYAEIFKNNGLCINSSNSFVKNIGHDGSGENCGVNKLYEEDTPNIVKKDFVFTRNIVETEIAIERVKKFFTDQKRSVLIRVINKISRMILKRV